MYTENDDYTSYSNACCPPSQYLHERTQFNQDPGPFSNTISTLSTASHEMLLRSGNAAYTSLHTRHLQVKYELEAQRNLVTQLQGVISQLASAASSPRSVISTSTTPGQETADGLAVPDAPDSLDQEDYPHIPYWQEVDWIAHCERQKDLGRPTPKLGFLTDSDGSPLTDLRMKKLMSGAKRAWNELFLHRFDPVSWTKKTPRAASYFTLIMKTTFPEFCYCEGDWKTERFAIIKYPDWCRDSREPGQLTRLRPSKRGSGENLKECIRRRKRAKTKTTFPPGAHIIDLGDDAEAGSTRLPSSSCMTKATTLTVNPPTLASAGLPRPPPHPLTGGGFSTTATVPITTAVTAPPQSTPSPQISAPATPSIRTTTPGNSESNAISPTLAASSSPSSPPVTPLVVTPLQNPPVTQPSFPALTNEPLCRTDPAGSSTPAPTSGQGLDVVDTAVAMLGSAADGRESQPLERRHPRRANPLAGLTIRKPSFEVPMEEPSTVASSGGPSSVARSVKGGKPMVASPTVLSARNLFALEYLKDNAPTTSEFKVIWDNISSDTKKKYEALSKEKKAATRAARNANTST